MGTLFVGVDPTFEENDRVDIDGVVHEVAMPYFGQNTKILMRCEQVINIPHGNRWRVLVTRPVDCIGCLGALKEKP